MNQLPILEIAANSLASALAAEEGGADRIELCCALELGGLTPSHAQLALARERVRIPIYVLIRPRAGDFVYTEQEFETMQRDIEHCVALGCDGVVIGALDAHGDVDSQNCRELIGAAGAAGVTFHRAIDVSRDPRDALEAIIALGCERVLTSGAAADASTGAPVIRSLVEQAANRIIVMPGAGIGSGNVAAIRAQTSAREFHASARSALPSRLVGAAGALPDMSVGEIRTDATQVRALLAALSADRHA